MGSYLEESRDLARRWDAARPRTRQKDIGWSGMADCRAYLGYLIRGDWPTDEPDKWRAIAGTALHAWWTRVRRADCRQRGIRAAFDVEVSYGGVKGHVDEVIWPSEPGGRWEVTDYKGLALDTPIPTPGGWTTMGAVQPGDEVFGSDGRRCRVLVKSAVKQIGTYIVRFGDGAEVVCDREHLWWAMRWPRGRNGKTLADGVMEVVGVEDMAASLRQSNGQVNWRVPVAGPLDLPAADLVVPPYVLGCWLGDGEEGCGRICGIEQTFTEIAREGFTAAPARRGGSEQRTVYGLHGLLRQVGILRGKNVPDQYLRGSLDQRIALIQGLMDSDGTWNRTRNRAVFTTTSKVLAQAMAELLASCGEKPVTDWRPARGFGLVVDRCAIEWTPTRFNPFRIPVKASLVPAVPGHLKLTRNRWRTVISIEPGPDVMTACIGVDSPDRTYLCGREMIPTHNTPRLASVRLWNDDQFLNELFIQPHGYAAGLLEPDAQERAWQDKHDREAWTEHWLDPDACIVRLIGMPVDGKMDDWVCHERPFERDIADDALARLDSVRAVLADPDAGEFPAPYLRDKPAFFCMTWCEMYTACRGGEEPKELEEITDPELRAAVDAYGLAGELISANKKVQAELRPVVEDARGYTDLFRIHRSRGARPKLELDEVAVEAALGSRGIPLTDVQRWGPPGKGSLTVKRA